MSTVTRWRVVPIGLGLLVLPPLAAQQATPAAPPCATSEHRQFDFWIGSWDVSLPDGTVAGENRIEAILGGCALQESWTGKRGLQGRSLNAWDAAAGIWRQSWVDGSGAVLELAGGLKEGRMILEGEVRDTGGKIVLHRITWEPLAGGAVRQHWQTSGDGGGAWNDAFVGIYRKRGG